MTLVIDASAVADLLLREEDSAALIGAIQGHDLVAPEMLVAETLSVIRGWTRSGAISTERARGALDDFSHGDIELFGLAPLLPRAFELRDRVSAYDAMYVALAEHLGCALLTRDARLARAVPELAVYC
ncbi:MULTISPECIES: type II toxin-antitoxin system VapC family toxin [unclassified Brachybacterium]|uniref:type II toxin-antitoxin system VapC family toxin n=1 Tax=unclassified Brachybacterium TaxID=2623841 RepID=UPI000C80E675|nr:MULTISPECIES: type II toxin-antitoxin system VapC family toxin [unclassified Brachybacterium]PMC75626.1 hypothetical protein CJ197_07770 [Brachybacterium sp. UMB0905]